MSAEAKVARVRPGIATVAAAGFALIFVGRLMTVGSDTMWLVALGDDILDGGGIPIGVPFAAADSRAWVNVPVLAEVVLAAVHSAGPLGLPTLHVIVDATLIVLLATGAARLGADDVATAVTVSFTVFGTLTTLGVVRAQMLSLAPFALLLLLLRSETAKPSHQIWLLVPLVVVWANLHGAVLAGVAVAGCYLLFCRLPAQPWVALGVGTSTLAAVLATPAGVRTPAYYVGVLTNEAAQRGSELWARAQLTNPFDVIMISVAALLSALALTRRPPLWEYAALAGLVVATVSAARHGVWLLLFVCAPAAAGLSRLAPTLHRALDGATRRLGPLSLPLAVVMSGGVALALWTRADAFAVDQRLTSAVHNAVGDQVVLAPEPLAETLAASGVTVWMSNPLDAFSRQDQSAYLAFVLGEPDDAARALEATDFVVAETGSAQESLAARTGFVVRSQVEGHVIMWRQDGGR